MNRLILLGAPLTLAACTPTGPDMGPVGAGLSVVGLGIVIAATIIALFSNKGGPNG